MIKTRNFAVAMTTIAVAAIGGVSVYAVPDILLGSQAAGVAFSSDTPETFSASIPPVETDSREDALAAMRKKIAERGGVFAAADTTEVAVTVEAPTPEDVPTDTAADDKGERRCSAYQPTSIAWNSAGVTIEAVEGARLVYKEGAPTMVGSTSVPTRNTLAQLPLRSTPRGTATCIGSDVIGISVNGALMRNTEVLAYAGFGAGAPVGYALDGFPIYSGAHTGTVDVCGGALVSGQYRYFVSSGQKTIINCYSGSPITL